MMAAAFGPASCSSGLVLKSELLHSPEAQSGFVPTLDLWSLATIGTQEHSLHGGKNIALRAKKPIMVEKMFFNEVVFLLLDVCNNDS